MHILVRLSLVALSLAVAACTERAAPPAPVAPAVPVPPLVPVPRPLPPTGSAPNLTIPFRLPDGSYATPNRSLSSTSQLWHLRVALNVAVLTCDDASQTMSTAYNRLLAARKKRFADTYKAVTAEYGSLDALDKAMTKLYNYFAQPPAQKGFCPVARETLTQVESTPDDGLSTFAAQAVPRLDQPFVDFYVAYDRYRSELAQWNAAHRPAPVAAPLAPPAPTVPMAPMAPTAPKAPAAVQTAPVAPASPGTAIR